MRQWLSPSSNTGLVESVVAGGGEPARGRTGMKVRDSEVPAGARSPWMVMVVAGPAIGAYELAGPVSSGRSLRSWAAMVVARIAPVAGVKWESVRQ